jgi:hypothetical protein
VNGSSVAGFRLRASGFRKSGFSRSARSVVVAALLLAAAASAALAEDAVLSLRATVVPATTGGALTVTVFRWSTDAERAPLLTALSAPPPAPTAPAAAGRAGAAAGRGGRAGGRGTPPPTPLERLATAVKAAPTLGYIWSDGVTGYSIKYAWRSAAPGERIVLVTDRLLGAHAPEWGLTAAPGSPADLSVIELRLDATGAGEGKTSLSSAVVVDPAASTLALDRFAAAPALLKVTR